MFPDFSKIGEMTEKVDGFLNSALKLLGDMKDEQARQRELLEQLLKDKENE